MFRHQQTAQDEDEQEAMAEAELSRVKRQYRIMENDRITYAEDVRLQLRNQQNMVQHLENEKAELVRAIKIMKCPLNRKKDGILAAKLKDLVDKRAYYMQIINEEKHQISELQEQILKVSFSDRSYNNPFNFHLRNQADSI